jgi:hypothetical protein
MDTFLLEYRVVPVTRYHVTRHWAASNGLAAEPVRLTEDKGEYDNPDLAHEVAYALCKDEHQRLGLSPGDERIVYPERTLNQPVLAKRAA